MSENPSTLRGESSGEQDVQWDQLAFLHRSDDGAGVLYNFKAVRNGTLAELVRFVMSLPEEHRRQYVIEKSGDHRLTAGEIAALSRRDDYPG